MADFDSTVDVNGRDESASLYVALLERQVIGLTLVNLRQKASLQANGMDIEVDYDELVDQTVIKMNSIKKDSKKGFRRQGV